MNNTSTQKSTSVNLNDLQAEIIHDTAGTEEHEPAPEVVDAILNYSKALSVRSSRNLGHVEVILN